MAVIDVIRYQIGIPAAQRMQAALLYEEAFGERLALAIPSRNARLLLLAESLDLSFAAAILHERVLGLAGFQTLLCGLTRSFGLRGLHRRLGLVGALRAVLVLKLYEHREGPAEMLLNGFAVARAVRGQGLGRGLLACVGEYARAQGYASIRLDVVESARGDRGLFEHLGFEPRRAGSFGWACGLFGYGRATSMVWRLRA